MYKALYDYKTDLSGYLSFQSGDQFTLLDNKQKDWFHVQNGFGQIGYVPKIYVERDSGSYAEVLQSIDRAIEVINYEAGSKGGELTRAQRENLQILIKHRENVVATYKSQGYVGAPPQETKLQDVPLRRSSRRTAPAPPTRTVSMLESPSQHQPDSLLNGETQQTEDVPVPVSVSVKSESFVGSDEQNKQETSRGSQVVDCTTNVVNIAANKTEPQEQKADQPGMVNVKTVVLPSNLGEELIEEVRCSTGLSYKKSGVAVETVLSHLRHRVPELGEFINRVYNTMQEIDSAVNEDETSSDYDRLCELFVALTECKDDSQQRGWALHEDESIITGHLEELASILENAKASISKRAIARDNYEYVDHLVEYYQMETRLSLRLLLLRVFVAMCSLDKKSITVLLFSILTTELAEEIQQHSQEAQRINHVTMVLTMLFSTGEPVPANLHEHVGAAFMDFVFGSIETPPCEDFDETTVELMVNLILAFNLHFVAAKDNLVMNVIAEKRTVKVFTEKILLLFNRDDDPVRVFDHLPQPPNSVMKLLQDLYSGPTTASILYTNDEKVLIDIILQRLVDLSPGDKARTSQLKLMQLFLTNSSYVDYRHRYKELLSCLRRILGEEQDTGDDKHIVSYILNELPVFKET